MWWQKSSQGYKPPHRPNHSCYIPGTSPDANTANMTGAENCLYNAASKRESPKVFLETACSFFLCFFFVCFYHYNVLKKAALWLNSGAPVWVLAGRCCLIVVIISELQQLWDCVRLTAHWCKNPYVSFCFSQLSCQTFSFFLIYTELNTMRKHCLHLLCFVSFMCVCVGECECVCMFVFECSSELQQRTEVSEVKRPLASHAKCIWSCTSHASMYSLSALRSDRIYKNYRYNTDRLISLVLCWCHFSPSAWMKLEDRVTQRKKHDKEDVKDQNYFKTQDQDVVHRSISWLLKNWNQCLHKLHVTLL